MPTPAIRISCSTSGTPTCSSGTTRARSTGCARRCDAIRPTRTRTTCSAAALQASGSTVEADARARAGASAVVALRRARAARGADKAPVPRGLERVRTDMDARALARPEQAIVNTAQREQRELATFHLDRGRRLFEREEDREAMAELRRAVYLSPYEAQAHLLIGRIHLRGGRPRGGDRRPENLDLERRHRPCARGARRGILEAGKDAGARADRAGTRAGARSGVRRRQAPARHS